MEVITSLTDPLSLSGVWSAPSLQQLSAFKIYMSKIYIGSAGSIPARQVDRDDNKLRVIRLKVLSAGLSGGFLYTWWVMQNGTERSLNVSVKLFNGNCLELLNQVKDESIDLVLADLPYGMTENKWDSAIPLEPLFDHYQRIIKEHGAVLLFGMGVFGARLMMSAPKQMPYRYDWIWKKSLPVGFLSSHHMPLRTHENIYVFYKHLPTYNPQMRTGFKPYKKTISKAVGANYSKLSGNYTPRQSAGERFPIDVLEFSNADNNNKKHPTQKPVDLLEYLIKTYTNEGMTVLDNTMGSGSTGVAAVSLNRNFIGMELNDDYFKVAKERIEKADRPMLAGFFSTSI